MSGFGYTDRRSRSEPTYVDPSRYFKAAEATNAWTNR